MSDIERFISLPDSVGVYEDFWLGRTASIGLKAASGAGLEVQLWVPDAKEGEQQHTEKRQVRYTVGEENGQFEDCEDGALISIIVPSVLLSQSAKLWVGTSFWQVIYDQGPECSGRQLGLRIHACRFITSADVGARQVDHLS